MAGYQRGGPNNETDIDDSITDDSTANLTKTVIAGEDTDGVYYNAGVEKSTDGNMLRVRADGPIVDVLYDILEELKKLNFMVGTAYDI